MSFETFQNSRVYIPSIGACTGHDEDMGVDGFMYADGYYIYNRTETFSDFLLVLGNEQYDSDTLQDLEYVLFAFCYDMGVFDEPEATLQDALSSLLKVYCDTEGLPFISADELAIREQVSTHQKEWLKSYVLIWDYVMDHNLEGVISYE